MGASALLGRNLYASRSGVENTDWRDRASHFMRRSRLDPYPTKFVVAKQNQIAQSIPVPVSVIISTVMVPMMVPVPPVNVGVTVVAVAVVAVVVRSVWLVIRGSRKRGINLCFGFGGY